eukprot:GHVT01051434.1.p1 GENE.GHVT01051434.1~~GHVT01051434.1.p1  ORF type:complete len:486 (-),score=120.43 GHVT01051434.1:4844-6301(-)
MAVCLARLFRLLFFRRVRRMPCCHALSGPATAPALPCVFCFFPPTCVLVVAFHPSGGSPPPAETSMTALLRLCFCTAILISALPPPPANAEKDAALRLGSFIDAVFEDKTRLHNKTALSALVEEFVLLGRSDGLLAQLFDKLDLQVSILFKKLSDKEAQMGCPEFLLAVETAWMLFRSWMHHIVQVYCFLDRPVLVFGTSEARVSTPSSSFSSSSGASSSSSSSARSSLAPTAPSPQSTVLCSRSPLLRRAEGVWLRYQRHSSGLERRLVDCLLKAVKTQRDQEDGRNAQLMHAMVSGATLALHPTQGPSLPANQEQTPAPTLQQQTSGPTQMDAHDRAAAAAVEMLCRLGVFSTLLEQPLLQHTADHYREESAKLVAALPLELYARRVELRLLNEEFRVSRFFASSILPAVLDVVRVELLVRQLPAFDKVDSIKRLIQKNAATDLRRIYQLLSQVGEVDRLKSRYAEAIKVRTRVQRPRPNDAD